MLRTFNRVRRWWRRRHAKAEASAARPSKRKIDRTGLFSTEYLGGAPSRERVLERMRERARASAPAVIAGAASAMDGLDAANITDMTGITGPDIPDTLFAWFGLQTFIGHQLCAVIAQHWLVDKACTMPARDAVRHGFDLIVKDDTEEGDYKTAIQDADRRFGVTPHMIDYVRKGRIFGIRCALYLVESPDPDYYKLPFNPDGVTPGSYKGVRQIDPYWMSPVFDQASIGDPTSLEFYEPTWWQINGKLYHRTHFAIFRTSPPPDLLKSQYAYGGVPVPQKIMERVYAAERTANETPQLAMSKRLTVWKTSIAHLLANQQKFAIHMANFTAFRDNFGVKVVDDDDEMEMFDTTLAGLNDLVNGQYKIVAAAAEVPSTKLLEISPKGMGGEGGYEEASYHESLESVQDNDLTPFLDGHHIRLARSEIEPQFGLAPGKLVIGVEWEPLDSPDAKEYAEINYLKAQEYDLLASAGAIDGQDIRDKIRGDKDSGWSGLKQEAPEPIEDPTLGTVTPNAAKAGKVDARG